MIFIILYLIVIPKESGRLYRTIDGSSKSKDFFFKHYVNILMIHSSKLLSICSALYFLHFCSVLTFTSCFCKNDAYDSVDIFHIFSIKKLVKKHTDCVFFLHYVIRWNDLWVFLYNGVYMLRFATYLGK